jgi:pimeloyl-ACP methyl ester carboxylesterase
MKRTHRNALSAVAGVVLLVYAAAVGFLAFNERAMVYASAGEGRRGRHVPGEDAGMSWDTLRARAADGVPVFLLRIILDSAAHRPWVIFFHGNAGMVGSRSSVDRYRLLRDAGFNVLAVEYRDYGASAGAALATEAGIHADARGALTYLTDSLDVPTNRIAVYGWSLGSGPAMRLAAETPIAALITEGAFTSLPDVGAELYPWVPVRLVMRNRFDNVSLAPRLTVPWIVFHGRHDSEIPFAHAELLARSTSRARLVPLSAGHDDGVVGDRDVALETLRSLAVRVGRLAP